MSKSARWPLIDKLIADLKENSDRQAGVQQADTERQDATMKDGDQLSESSQLSEPPTSAEPGSPWDLYDDDMPLDPRITEEPASPASPQAAMSEEQEPTVHDQATIAFEASEASVSQEQAPTVHRPFVYAPHMAQMPPRGASVFPHLSPMVIQQAADVHDEAPPADLDDHEDHEDGNSAGDGAPPNVGYVVPTAVMVAPNAEIMEENTYGPMNSEKDFEARCKELQDSIEELIEERENTANELKDMRAEMDMIEAAIAHWHASAPKIIQLDAGRFGMTRQKALTVITSLQAIIAELEASD